MASGVVIVGAGGGQNAAGGREGGHKGFSTDFGSFLLVTNDLGPSDSVQ